MKRDFAAGFMVAAAVATGFLAGPRLLDAQQGKPTGPHVIVIKDVMHVLSPRLGGMKPIPPAYGVHKQIPLRHPLPLKSTLAPAAPDPVLQTSTGPLVSASSGSNFLGVGVGQPGYGDCCAPPDTNGSAGATQYVQWVNTDFAVFSKSSGQMTYGPAAGNTLWSALGGACASHNSGDPIAQYDKQAQRWVMLQPVFSSPYYLCVAVSTTSDATGAYNLYQFPIPSNYFPDYPKLAVWPDGYYVSYNAFLGNSFAGGYACALDRTSMLAGNAATMQCFNSGYPSLLPSDLDGDSGAPGTTKAPPAGAPDYFVDFSSTNALNLFDFHVDWSNSANSTFTGPTVIPVASFSEACGGGTCVPQLGTSEQLDSLGDRLMYRFAYRNFGSYQSLVVSQSVTAGTGGTTGVRWYEIRNPGPNATLYQQGTFAPDSNYRWMPSIAEDENGDIALGYSVSSGTMNPAIRFTGRVPSDKLGAMESESSIIEGTGSQLQNLSRWGDYSDMSVDPANDCTFWYTNEFLQANGTFNWSTQIASFSIAGCGSTATPDFSLSASPNSQTVTQGNQASYTIAVTPSGTYAGTVNFTYGQLPPGTTASFTPGSVTTSGGTVETSNLIVTTSGSTTAGTYNFTVTGADSSGSPSHSIQIGLTVQQPTSSDFKIGATPSNSSAAKGSSTSYSVSIAGSGTGPFNGTVNLSVTGVPSRTSASFNPTSITGQGSSTLTLSPHHNASNGTYTLTITGTSGSISHSVNVTFTVGTTASGGSGDFSLSASPSSLALTAKSSATSTITITPSGSFAGGVTLSVSGLPHGTSATFNPSTATTSSTLTITAGGHPQTGNFPLKITGTSGGLSHSTTVALTVN